MQSAINRDRCDGPSTATNAEALAVVFGRLLLAWLEEIMADDQPGLIVVNPSFVGPGGQEFPHTDAVLTAAAEANVGSR